MPDRLAILLQYILPKLMLTRFMGWLASIRGGRCTHAVIRWFVRRYGVDMSEAAQPDVTTYGTFNEFFTRPLREGARPLADVDFVCPVDGAISQCGAIGGDRLLQAKGHEYTVQALLGGDRSLAEVFKDGSFATLYLSPRDYHRIHMPCHGRLKRMIHVPGELFSVNPLTARSVPGLFARNERVVCVFEGEACPFVMVLVGATIVGSMATVWHGVVNPHRPGQVREWSYPDGATELDKGAEMGRFLLGSTVVLLFPRDTLVFPGDWSEGRPVRMGEVMGHEVPTSLHTA